MEKSLRTDRKNEELEHKLAQIIKSVSKSPHSEKLDFQQHIKVQRYIASETHKQPSNLEVQFWFLVFFTTATPKYISYKHGSPCD